MYDNLEKESSRILNLVSKNVVKFRKEKGYSQLKLATEIGYSSASYLGRMEIRKDDEHFNIQQLSKIAYILDVDISLFFKE